MSGHRAEPSGPARRGCVLREAVGERAVRESYEATLRRIHGRHPLNEGCADAHAAVEYLIEREHLVPADRARRLVEVAYANSRADVEAAQQRAARAVESGRDAERRLAAVLALIDHRRKTVRTDALREALGHY